MKTTFGLMEDRKIKIIIYQKDFQVYGFHKYSHLNKTLVMKIFTEKGFSVGDNMKKN